MGGGVFSLTETLCTSQLKPRLPGTGRGINGGMAVD
jgi:hypothetical protein